MIPDSAILVASPGSGAPETLLRNIPRVCEGREWTLFTGLLLGDYSFLDAVEDHTLRYVKSHVMKPVQEAVRVGNVDFVPVRYSHIGSMIEKWGKSRPVAALVRLTQPDRTGTANLGVSTSYARRAVELADVVIAELDPEMPATFGDTAVPMNRVDAWVRSEERLPEYRQAPETAASGLIAERVMGLIPDEATVQIGIGAVPDSVARRLAEAKRTASKFVGLIGDAIVDLTEAGLLKPDESDPPVKGVELMGTERLWRWANRIRLLGMYGSERGHAPRALGGLPGFISVNSAVEVDLRPNQRGIRRWATDRRPGWKPGLRGGGVRVPRRTQHRCATRGDRQWAQSHRRAVGPFWRDNDPADNGRRHRHRVWSS
jgi:4-hydroxybutyrate CoA-transferase